MSRIHYLRRRVAQEWFYLEDISPEDQTLDLFRIAVANHEEGNIEEVAEVFAHYDAYKDSPKFWFRLFADNPLNIVFIPCKFHREWMLGPLIEEWEFDKSFQFDVFDYDCLSLKGWLTLLRRFPETSLDYVPEKVWSEPDIETWKKFLFEFPCSSSYVPEGMELGVDVWVRAVSEDDSNIVLENVPKKIWEDTLFQYATLNHIAWDDEDFYHFCRASGLDPRTREARRAFKYPESPGIPRPRRIVI